MRQTNPRPSSISGGHAASCCLAGRVSTAGRESSGNSKGATRTLALRRYGLATLSTPLDRDGLVLPASDSAAHVTLAPPWRSRISCGQQHFATTGTCAAAAPRPCLHLYRDAMAPSVVLATLGANALGRSPVAIDLSVGVALYSQSMQTDSGNRGGGI